MFYSIRIILFISILVFTKLFSCAQTVHLLGELAPNITIPNISGTNIQLSDLKGKVVLIDFWASWCGPCRMANEETIEVYHEYKNNGFEIFSVSLDRKKEPWLRAIKDDALPWLYHGCDFKEWNSESCLKYKVDALPTTFLVDEYGKIVAADIDYYDIRKILKKHFNNIVFFPRESANKLIISTATKFEIQSDIGETIFKGNASEIDISSLKDGDYMLKIDGKEEHFKKISNNSSIINYTIENHIIKLSKPSDVKIYSKRGIVMYENNNATEISKIDYLNGDYFIWIDGLIYHLGI